MTSLESSDLPINIKEDNILAEVSDDKHKEVKSNVKHDSLENEEINVKSEKHVNFNPIEGFFENENEGERKESRGNNPPKNQIVIENNKKINKNKEENVDRKIIDIDNDSDRPILVNNGKFIEELSPKIPSSKVSNKSTNYDEASWEKPRFKNSNVYLLKSKQDSDLAISGFKESLFIDMKNINQRKLKLYIDQLIINSLMQGILTIIFLLSGVLYYTLTTSDSSIQLILILCICFIVSLFHIVTVILEYYIESGIQSLSTNLSISDLNSKCYRLIHLIIVILFLLLTPYPFIHSYTIRVNSKLYPEEVNQTVKVNYIISIVSQIRILYLFKCYIYWNYYSSRLYRLCLQNNYYLSPSYGFKVFLQDEPFKSITFIYFIATYICFYGIRITEKNFEHITNRSFDYLNSLWYFFVTGSTIGYGDFYPVTELGRIIGILICLFSQFILGFFINSIDVLLHFNDSPMKKRMYLTLNAISASEEKKNDSATLIINYMRLVNRIKKNPSSMNSEKISNKRDNLVLSLGKIKGRLKNSRRDLGKSTEEEDTCLTIDSLIKKVDQIGKVTIDIRSQALRLAEFVEQQKLMKNNAL